MSYEFYGRHLLLELSGCNIDLDNLDSVRLDLTAAVDSVGATILDILSHQFEPMGISIVMLLSESHATIHTYPEYNSCFLDIFTCGRSIHLDSFATVLIDRWQPQTITKQLIERTRPTQPNIPVINSNVRQLLALSEAEMLERFV